MGFNVGDLKNNTLFQIVMWQCFGQLVSGLTANLSVELSHRMNDKAPNEEISPEALASAVNRGFMSEGDAAQEARYSGIDGNKFSVLTKLAGDAPGVDALAEALRRELIPYDAGSADGVGFIQGIRQGNLSDKWADMIKALSMQEPTPNDALDALLEGQTDPGTAQSLYKKFGGDPQYFQLLFNTRGSAPTPTEAADMANRGIIPWSGTGPDAVSFEQAFLEGPWRNKWEPAFRKYGEYVPPPRTVTAMVREGSLTDEQAMPMLEKNGLTPELAAAYLKAAHKAKTSSTKDLALSTVSKLYLDRIIDKDTAAGLIQELGYSSKDASYIISVDDMADVEKTMSAVMSKIRTLYVNRSISASAASSALARLGVPAGQVTELMELYNLERSASAKHATESEVRSAFKYGIIKYEEALTDLENMGYPAYDAWLMLSIEMKAAQGTPPQKA